MVKSFGIIPFVLIICGVFCSTCNKPDISKTKTLKYGKLLVFGHGGSGFGILNTPNPPNSEESIIGAIDFNGADGVEIDIQVVRDSAIVVYHDEDLITQTNCKGCIQALDSAEIRKCRYRKAFINTNQESQVIFLNQVIERFSKYTVKPHISLNVHLHYNCMEYEQWEKMDAVFARKLAELVNTYNGHDWIFIESEVPRFLNRIQEHDSSIKLFYIADINAENITTCVANNFAGFVSSHHKTTSQNIMDVRARGLLVSLYNANIRPDLKEAINNLPDFIQTDNIVLAKQLLRQ